MIEIYIRNRCRTLNLGPKEAAEKAGINKEHFAQLLAGKRLWPKPYSSDLYERLAKALECDLSEIEALAHEKVASYLDAQAENHRNVAKVVRKQRTEYELEDPDA